MTTVSLIHGDDRRANVRRALEILPPEDTAALVGAGSVLVKPNLVHHRNQLASSHVDAVRGVLDFVRARTGAPVTVADSSYHGTKAAFEAFGYENLLKEYDGVELFDLNDDETVPGYFMKRDGSKGEMGCSKRVADAGFTISLTQMKTHRDVGVSLTMKNWTIGTWVPEPRWGTHGKYWPRWPYLHEEGAYAHHSTIAELLGTRKPSLAVVDAFLAMEGDGPTRGEPVEMRCAIAGTDCLAVDAMACPLMGIDPADIGYLAMAAERGYGEWNRESIAVVGEADAESLKREFKRPDSWQDQVLAWKRGLS